MIDLKVALYSFRLTIDTTQVILKIRYYLKINEPQDKMLNKKKTQNEEYKEGYSSRNMQ